jgi:hypothetical protein
MLLRSVVVDLPPATMSVLARSFDPKHVDVDLSG